MENYMKNPRHNNTYTVDGDGNESNEVSNF